MSRNRDNANYANTGQRKNYLINGNFDMWQYGTSQTTSGYGSADRWINNNVISTKTYSRVACTDTERALFNASYFSRTVSNYVDGTGSIVNSSQVIEDITKIAGKVVTLSFWAKADSNKKINIGTTSLYGSGGSPSTSGDYTYPATIDVTNQWAKYKITLTAPSIVGKTLGTDGVHTTALVINFVFTASADRREVVSGGFVAGQSGTFDIAQVKLEDGSVATDGWHPYDGEFGGEVHACERYYEKSQLLAGLCYYQSTAYQGGVMVWSYKAGKRVVPTIVITASSGTKTAQTSNSSSNGVSFVPQTQATNVADYMTITATASAEL